MPSVTVAPIDPHRRLDSHGDLRRRIEQERWDYRMALRVARGFFRLWVLGSILFVLAVASVAYSEIKAQFDAVAVVTWAEQNSVLLIPQLCGNARGVAGIDYPTKEGQNPGPWDAYANPNPFDNCWYAISNFRLLYPEFNNLSDKDLSSKLYVDHGIPIRDLPNPWITLVSWAGIAFMIPLAALILGGALGWALKGFADQ
jgi:hypothetical protein